MTPLAKLVEDALTDDVLDKIREDSSRVDNTGSWNEDIWANAWRTGILAALEAEQRKGGEDAPASLTPLDADEFVELAGMLSLATEQDDFHAAHALRLCWSRVQQEYERRLRTAEAECNHAKNCTAMMQAKAESALTASGRYEYVRCLNVQQFKALFEAALQPDARFDDLVDSAMQSDKP